MKLLVLTLIIGLAACNASKKMTLTEESTINLERIAQEKYGSRYISITNTSKSHTLVINKTKTFREFGFDINYFLFENKAQKIIMEDFLKSGQVEWISDLEIKATNKKLDEKNDLKRIKEVYVYNIETDRKILL